MKLFNLVILACVIVLFGTDTFLGADTAKPTTTKPNATASATASDLLPKELFEQLKLQWPKNRIINIVFHGHSVPAGYYVTPEIRPFEAYPHLVYKGLKEKYPFAQINCIVTAIGGERSDKGAKRFEKDVLTHKPDLIFIDYAINDRKLSDEVVRKSWIKMIEAAQKEKIPVVLITPTGVMDAKYDDPKEPLNMKAAIIRELAAEYHCPLADIMKDWKAKLATGIDQATMISNKINHPNLIGHQLAADTILEVFKQSDK